jgi:hypothetical protein
MLTSYFIYPNLTQAVAFRCQNVFRERPNLMLTFRVPVASAECAEALLARTHAHMVLQVEDKRSTEVPYVPSCKMRTPLPPLTNRYSISMANCFPLQGLRKVRVIVIVLDSSFLLFMVWDKIPGLCRELLVDPPGLSPVNSFVACGLYAQTVIAAENPRRIRRVWTVRHQRSPRRH